MVNLNAVQRIFRAVWIFAAPLIFSPLLFLHSKEMACAYGILVISSFWLLEVVPIPVTSLLPVFVFPILGLISTKEICNAYIKDTSMLFLCTLMTSLAVEESNLHHRLALFMISKIGGKPLPLMIGMTLVVSFISFWISDVAATALMVPITVAMLESMVTVRADPPISANGATVEENWCSETQGTVKERLQLDRLSSNDRALCKALILACSYGSLIGGTAVVTATGPNLIFREQIYAMLGEADSKITFLSWSEFALPSLILYLPATIFSILLVFYGPRAMLKLFKKASDEDRVKAKVFAATVAKARTGLGPMSFAEKSVLGWILFMIAAWIFRAPGFMKGWAELIFGSNGKLLSDTSIGIFVIFVFFAWPKRCPRFRLAMCHWKKVDAKAEEAESQKKKYETDGEALLTWSVVQKRLPWSVIILIGAGFAFSEVIKKSCLEELISQKVLESLHGVPPVVVQLAITTVVTFMTEIAGALATTSVFVPIALNSAVALGLNPLYLGLPSAIAASFAFMFPMATAPNAVVYDTGVITILEMASVGIILSVICIAIATLNMNTWAYWLFDLGKVPLSGHYLQINSTCVH